MKCDNLYQEFKRFEGQPVKIFTDDGKSLTGIDLVAYDDSVRIIDKCNRTILISYDHIDSVVEPQMDLDRCCHEDDCRRRDRDDADDEIEGNGRYRCRG